MNGRSVTFLAFALALIISGCKGEKRHEKLEPTLQSIQALVFDATCVRSSCHDSYTPESQLVLTRGKSHSELVNKPSVVMRHRIRVVPFRSEQSYLVDKLTGNRIVGERMPVGRPRLPDSTIAIIRQWIDQGALNN
jgi:hypothetical protein